MKKRYIAFILPIIALCFFSFSCARMPSSKTSAHILEKHFKRYGKKYKDTVYGTVGVQQVEVLNTTEVHKHLVSTEAFVTLKDGDVQRIFATLEKGPLWWRFISWENATGM